MMKKTFKIFLNPVESQENWLNQMAKKGLQLVDVGRFLYFQKRKSVNINMP